jgi:RNA polymerase primary sigma factor
MKPSIKTSNNRLQFSDSTQIQYLLTQAEKYPILPSEEQLKLVQFYRSGDKRAKEKLILHNLKLIINIASSYSLKKSCEFGDLVQEGIFGLTKAIDKFNFSHNCKFTTYATPWIYQAIKRAYTEKSNIIKIPVHLAERKQRTTSVIKKFIFKNNRNPTIEELAVLLETKPSLALKRLAEIKAIWPTVASLDFEISNDSDSTPLLELMTQENCGDVSLHSRFSDPVEKTEKELLKASIKNELKKLPDRYKLVLELKFGLDGSPDRTLEEVAAIYNSINTKQITRQGISNIINRALARLRKNMQV